MKNSFFILLFLLITVDCFSQSTQQGCASFKKGKFAYRDSTNTIIHVTRTIGRQQEEDKKNKIITKFKIKWTSDCEYELTQTWSNNKTKRKQNRAVTRVVITKMNGDDSYEYNCACRDRQDRSNSGMMVRLNE